MIAPAALRASRKPAALVTAQTPSLVPCFHFIMGVPAVVSVGGVVAAASDIMSVGWACVGVPARKVCEISSGPTLSDPSPSLMSASVKPRLQSG